MKKYTIFRERLGALSRNLWQGEYAIDRKISVGLFLMLFIALSSISTSVRAQSITLGTATTSSTTYGPIYRSGSTSLNDYSACKYLFTAAELQAAGLPVGATITSIEFYLNSTSIIDMTSTGTAIWDFYMKNSSLTTGVATTASDITSTFTQVSTLFMDAGNNFPGATGWYNISLMAPFVYGGSSLEIASLWDCSMISGNPTTGSLTWQYSTSPTTGGTLYANNSSPITTVGSATTARPNIKINYTPPPACSAAPAGGTATSTVPVCTQEPVTISLSGGTVASGMSYQLESSPAGANTWSAIGAAQTNSIFTDIPLVNTDYRIVSTCTATSATGTSTPTTVTVAVAPPVPIDEHFDLGATGTSTNNTVPSCWGYLESAGHAGYAYIQNSTLSRSLPNRYYMYNSSNVTDPQMLRSVAMSNLSNGNNRVRFWALSTSTSSPTVEIGTLSDPNDPTTFSYLATIPLTTSWVEHTVNIPAGTNSAVAFKHGNTATIQSVYLDDIYIEPIPTCLTPTAVNYTAVTPTSVNVGWTDNNTNPPAGGWIIEYGAPGFTPGTGTSVAAATNPFNLTGLTSATTYSIFVKAVCVAGADTSAFNSTPLTVTTPCSPAAVPFFDGFESGYTDATAVTGCWLQEGVIGATTGTNTWTANSSATTYNRTPRTGSFNAYLRYGNERWLFHPVDLVGGISYTFEAYARQDGTTPTNSNLTLAYGTAPNAASMTNIVSGPQDLTNSSTYDLHTGTFTPPTSGTYYIGIKGYMNSSPWYISLDDISLYPSPTCLKPTAPVASNVSFTTGTIAWTENNATPPAGGWLIEYGPAGFALGTGTLVAAPSNPHTLTGLTPETNYSAYVRAVCTPGSDTSAWSSVLNFYTGYCAPVVSTSTTYYMTSLSTTGGSTNISHTATSYASYTNKTTDTLVAQAGGQPVTVNITMSSGTHYYYMWADWDNNFSFDDPGETLINTTTFANALNKAITIPSNIAPGSYRIRFGTSFSGNITSGCGSGRSGNFVDFVIKVLPPPTCSTPTATTVTATTPTSATLAWTDNNATPPVGGWQVEYGPAGYTPGTGTSVAASTNPFVLSGLTPNTSYVYYVRAICTPGSDTSYWSASPTSFMTPCSAFPAPYTYDVEAAAVTTNSTISDCWSSSPTGITTQYRWDLDGAGSTPSSSTGPAGANSGVKYFYTEASSGVFGDTAKLLSPLVDITTLTTPYLQYAYHMYGSNTGNLYAQIWDGTAFVTVDSVIGQTQSSTSLPWQIAGIDVSTLAATTTQIRFLAVRGNGTLGDISVDDIALIEAPACLNPTNITGNYVPATGNLDISWTPPSGTPPAGYNYVVVLADSGYAASNVRAAGSTTGTTASISGLTSGSSYDVYVQSDCGSGSTSNWTGPFIYLPPCLEVIPYTQDFEGTGCLPTCWNKENLNGDGFSFCMAGQVPCAGTKGMRLDPNTSSTAPANNDWVYSPVFNLTAGTSYRIKFTYKSDQATKLQKLAMYVGDLQANAAQTNLLFKDDSINSTTCQNVVIDYTPTASGLATFGFWAYAASNQGNVGIDNFSVDYTPAMSTWSVADNSNNDVCTDSSVFGVAGSAWHELHDATGKIVLSINPNGNYLGTVKVKYIDQASPEEWGASGSGSSAMYKTVPRRFAITPQHQPTSPVDVRFYFQGEELDDFNASSLGTGVTSYSVPALLFTKHEVTTPDCILTNNAGQASLITFIDAPVGAVPTTGSQDFYVEASVPDFSEFTLHEPTTNIGPLSIKFENFAGRLVGDKVVLSWNLLNATSGNSIGIEKLHNGIWRNIGDVEVNASQAYSFTDNEVAALNTYRLSYLSKKSEVVSIKDLKGTIVSIYPNPADNYIKVEVENATSSELKVNIYDVVGRTLITKSISTTRNAASEEIQIGDLPAGNYLIKVEDSNSVLYNSVLIVK